MANIVRLLLGLAILTSGRKLYWLFVGIVGFMLGLSVSTLIFAGEAEIVHLAIALVVGVIGVVLALLFKRIAVGLAGFLAGGYILTSLFAVLGWAIQWPFWILFLIGGSIGAVLVMVFLDWALIILSSWAGASLIVQTIQMPDWLRIFLYIFLLVVGVSLQAANLRKKQN